MIELVNFFILIFSTILFLYFYVLSVSPAFYETEIGKKAYKRCGIYRTISMIFMFITCINYVIYYFYPLSISLSRRLFVNHWISVIIGIVILIPSATLMIKGIIDAGKEAIAPQEGQTLYKGIYDKIRHPQAQGEVFLFWVIAFILNSPFLIIYSFIWLPIFYLICIAEEKDLLLRFGKDYIDYRNKTGMFIPRKNYPLNQ
jgi:methanethiol S-methyltransferase